MNTYDLLLKKTREDLDKSLLTFFTNRQKQIILKTLRGKRLSKTESHYYSRVIKKKLRAISNPTLHKLAQDMAFLF